MRRISISVIFLLSFVPVIHGMLGSSGFDNILTDKNNFVYATSSEDSAKIRVMQFKNDGTFCKEFYLDFGLKELDTILLDFIDDSGNFWGNATLESEGAKDT